MLPNSPKCNEEDVTESQLHSLILLLIVHPISTNDEKNLSEVYVEWA